MLLKTTGERYKNDISERLQKKKSLQQSNELKRKLIETLNVSIFMCGCVVYYVNTCG